LPATLNTIRVDYGDPTNPARVSADDGGAFNVATSPEAASGKELGYFNEPLAGSIIPEAMRPLVSRWGFDPAWREAAYPPLSVDQILSRKSGTTYEWLAESPSVAAGATGTPAANPIAAAASSTKPAATTGTPKADERAARSQGDAEAGAPADGAGPVRAGAGSGWRPVWLALHDVQYDAVKERWFVDLRIDLTEVARRHQSNPFVQLALVAFQANGLPGQRVSPVALCDMYKLRGDRVLEAVRRDRLHFTLALRGEFEHTLDRREFPRRQVVARLQLRDPSLPREIVEHASPAAAPRRRGAAPLHAATSTRTLAEYELSRSTKGDAYTATVELEPSDLDVAEQAGLPVIAVEEYEIYPAAEAGRGELEDGLFVLEGRLCVRQLVYAFQLEIGTVNSAAPVGAAGS
jgi:hypothetical protein